MIHFNCRQLSSLCCLAQVYEVCEIRAIVKSCRVTKKCFRVSSQGRRAGSGPGQRRLRHADGAHHGAAQPEGLFPPPHHLRLLHPHLHHLHPPAARDALPAPARDARRRRELHPAAAPPAEETRGTAPPAASVGEQQGLHPGARHAAARGGRHRRVHHGLHRLVGGGLDCSVRRGSVGARAHGGAAAQRPQRPLGLLLSHDPRHGPGRRWRSPRQQGAPAVLRPAARAPVRHRPPVGRHRRASGDLLAGRRAAGGLHPDRDG